MARHTALALQIPVTGPLPLPRELTRWSSNKGPFVHAKSKVVFERRVHSQRIDVWDADDKAAEVLIKVLLATGRGEHVKVKVEKFSRDRCVPRLSLWDGRLGVRARGAGQWASARGGECLPGVTPLAAPSARLRCRRLLPRPTVEPQN